MSPWRALPSLSMLRAFDATARAGSFAEAGRVLGKSEAAVKMLISRGLQDLRTRTSLASALRKSMRSRGSTTMICSLMPGPGTADGFVSAEPVE